MRKNGFTLIELLAVITILAIILLIAVPIVLRLTKDSKKSTAKESLELYGRAVENAVANYFMNNPDKDDVSIGILESQNLIQYKGTKVQCDEVLIRNKQVYMADCKVGEEHIDDTYGDFTPMGTLVSDSDNNNQISIGDKYKYKVNSEDEFNFYVLSIDGDKVSLIMDRNICENGTVDYAKDQNHCRYAWHWQTQHNDDNNYGPDIAMTTLYNATKKWTNVPDMIMNYEDENNKENNEEGNEKGYTSIITNKETKVTTITGKPASKTTPKQTFGNTTEPLKARLPKESEVTSNDAGCHIYNSSTYQQDYGTCSTWLVENLTYYDVSSYAGSGNSDKYNEINKNNGITDIYGYWLLSSYPGYSYNARLVRYYGYVGNNYTTDGLYGARPVITVSKSDLS